jgi:cell division protein FtsL
MKKNAMLKIAAILMVAVLLTTCAISSTFAKYTTRATSSTNARVAKWGVTVDADVFSETALFKNAYSSENGSVDLATDELGMAPGTKGSIDLDANIEGQPEVSGEVIVKVTFTIDDSWKLKDGSTFHCPLKVSAGTKTNQTFSASTKVITVEETFKFAPDDKLDDKVTFPIAWEWAFANDGELTETETGDSYDAQVASGSAMPTLKVDLSITVVQTGSAVTDAPAQNG